MVDPGRALGAFLGSAIGDALGMPIEGLSHQNVRTYYRGIKEYRADEKRKDLGAGQWTHRTQLALKFGEALLNAEEAGLAVGEFDRSTLRRLGDGELPPGSAAAAVVPVAVCSLMNEWSLERTLAGIDLLMTPFWPRPESRVAAFGQACAIQTALQHDADDFSGRAFVSNVADATAWAEMRLRANTGCSSRLTSLAGRLDQFPLDLQEACDGTGFAADEAWPFAVAMFARNPRLVEGTILSALNVGGDSSTIGACTGALVGAFNSVGALSQEWIEGVEGRGRIEELVSQFFHGRKHR